MRRSAAVLAIATALAAAAAAPQVLDVRATGAGALPADTPVRLAILRLE